jgi:hypothetical protein
VGKDFVLLADRTPFNILGDPVIHSQPREVTLGLSDHFISPQVSCHRVVMYQGHEVALLGFGDSTNGDRLYELLRWEYDYVLVVLLSLVNVRGSGEDVQPHVGFTRYMVNDEVIFL